MQKRGWSVIIFENSDVLPTHISFALRNGDVDAAKETREGREGSIQVLPERLDCVRHCVSQRW